MIRFLSLLTFLVIGSDLFAQAPAKISYQAVIRNSSNTLVANTTVAMRISILRGSISGSVVFSELHNPTTNANGLISIEIGGGTPLVGALSTINWSQGSYFLKTETDVTNGTNYNIIGTSQLLSVPYALISGNGFSKISSNGDTLYLDNGKFILIPGISNANSPCQQFNAGLSYGSLNDIDGNTYKTIQIGNQTWMAENLKVTKYRNGVAIPNITNATQWANNTTGAWLFYDNDQTNNNLFGKLYNWYAATNTNGICPTGWHLPTDSDWQNLISYLDPSASGNTNIAGGKMKSVCPTLWQTPNTSASNSSGFSGLPGGSGSLDVGFFGKGGISYWWSTLDNSPTTATHYSVKFDNAITFKFGSELKKTGVSIRCIKD